MKQGLPQQRGAATLLLVMGLVVLATLASAWSSRAVLMDLLGTQARGQALQARYAAQAALATAQADLLQMQGASLAHHPFADPALRRPCPDGWPGPRWQCARLPLGAGPTLPGWDLQALAMRELISAPHVWQLQAWARAASGAGHAQARASLFVPVLAPAPAQVPAPALLVNGCWPAGASSRWQLCPAQDAAPACTGSSTSPVVQSLFVPDTDGNGQITPAEVATCLALPPQSLPGGGTVSAPAWPVGRSPCNRAAWRHVFGDIQPWQLQAWSQAQADNGLHPNSQPARTIYWVDSPSDWTLSVGSPQSPVLLVFSSQACAVRCPRIAAGVQVYGTVFLDAGCEDEKLRGWQAGTIDGLLAVEGGLPEAGGEGLIRARRDARQAFSLHWPAGIDARTMQRVAGSQREGSP